MKKIFLKLLFFFGSTIAVMAQTPPNPDGMPDDPMPGQPGAPIDNALIWLFMAGITGAYFWLQKKEPKKEIKH